MIVFLLITTLITSFLIIKFADYTKDYFFNLSTIVTTPNLVGLIFCQYLLNNNLINENLANIFNPIFFEFSLLNIKAFLCFSLILLSD